MRVRTTQVSPQSEFRAIFFAPGDKSVDRIERGQHFSISLLSAYICGFREVRGLNAINYDPSNHANNPDGGVTEGCANGMAATPGRLERVTRGEITILANVGEASDQKSLTMNPADEGTKGHVIYYNDDIRESGQLINALNLPIYGPKEYQGKNLVFDLWMLELDNEENERVKSLLSSLADIGATSRPESAPILQVLNTLGGSLLSGNQDDVEARFQMRFDVPPPFSGEVPSNIFRLPLAEGYYAFVREENRDLNPSWGEFAVNKEMGELCLSDDGMTCVQGNQNTYRGRTWYLVRVARESKASALDIEFGEQLGSFLGRLGEYEAADFTKVEASLNDLESSLKSLVCSKASSADIKGLNCP